MPHPPILHRTPTRLLTTTLTTTTTMLHCSRTIYTSRATALCQLPSRQPRLPSIASLSISRRRWASVGGRAKRYEPPSREERMRAVAVRDSATFPRLAPSEAGNSGKGGAAWGGGRGDSFAGVRERNARGQWYRGHDRDGSDRESNRRPDSDAARYTGPRRRLPNPAPPPSGKPSTLHSETYIPQLNQNELGSIFSQELFVFRCDVSAALITSAMSAYPRLKSLSLLLPDDISNLSRQQHNRFRADRSPSAILPHLKTLIADLQSGSIPGHPLASVHILSCLKDMSHLPLAFRFWDWLKQQSTDHTDARVYGAIIEVLATAGEPLPVLENLYDEAFQRYSNNKNISPTLARETGATHIMLLQGIITARIYNGEWRSAYEAFDLILRLYPTATPTRVYELFIYDRPPAEAFTVFLLACRAGTPLKPGVLTALLNDLWNYTRDPAAMVRGCWAYAGAGGMLSKEHLNSLIKGILLSWPHPPPSPPQPRQRLEGGSEVDVPPQKKLPQTTTTTTTTSPPTSSSSSTSSSFMTLLLSIRALITAFRQQKIHIDSSTFNTIISCGGKLSRGDLVLGGLRDMLKLNIRPTDVTFRNLVIVSANLQDPVQLKESWDMLVQQKRELRDRRVLEQRARGDEVVDTSLPWDFKDWQALGNTSYALGKGAFAKAELETYKHEMDPNLYTQVWNYLANAHERELEMKSPEGNFYPPNPLHATFNLEKIVLEVTRLLQTLKSPTVIPFSPPEASTSGSKATPSSEPNFTTYPSSKTTTSIPKQSDPQIPPYLEIDMYLTSPSNPPLPTPRLQEIYNQLLSTSPSPYSGQSPSYLGPGVNNDAHNLSTTGYTLRELRFQNWVTVNRLLFEAELHERRIEAKARRDMIKSGSSISMKIANQIMWKDEQIRERVRQVQQKAREELAKGEDVDVDVKSGRVVRRNEEAWKNAIKGVKAEEWEIRKLLGGGGWAWASEGNVITPEMFDKREAMGAAEKPVSAKEKQPAEGEEKKSAKKNVEVKVKVESSGKLEKTTPKTSISPEVTRPPPTPSPKPATTPSTPSPPKPIATASAPAPTQISASRKPSASAAAPISQPLGSAPIAATAVASAKSRPLGPPWPTVPFIPKPKASPIEIFEELKAVESQVEKAEPSEKAEENSVVPGGPWPTVPFIPKPKASPIEISEKLKAVESQVNKAEPSEKVNENSVVPGGPWPTVPFIPKPKASPIEISEELKALESQVKNAEPSEKAEENSVVPGGPWPTVPFVPRTKALPEEVTKEMKEVKKEEEKKQNRAEKRLEKKLKNDKEASEAAREVRERKKKEKEAAKKAKSSKNAVAKEQSTRDSGKSQLKGEIVVPVASVAEAAVAIHSTQTAEISSTESGTVEEALTAATPKPEPIPGPINLPFVSPLLHGSHITETTTPQPRGAPPLPEQVQEAIQELAALSEAENELADIYAELFAIKMKVSSATVANPTAVEQPVATVDLEKDGDVAVKAPQGDQIPALEPPGPSPTTTTPTLSTPTPQEPKESHVEQRVREEVPRGDEPEEAAGTGSRPGKEESE